MNIKKSNKYNINNHLKKCLVCKKEFFKNKKDSKYQWSKRKFCSNSCFGKFNMMKEKQIKLSLGKLLNFIKEHGAWNKGKKMDEKWVERARKLRIGKSSWNKSLTKKEDKRLKIAGQKQSSTKKELSKTGKLKSKFKGKTYEERYGLERAKEIKSKLSMSIINAIKSGKLLKSSNTKPERQIKEELIKRGFIEGKDFVHQYSTGNRYTADFAFPNKRLVVECLGDYWHANPSIYGYGPTTKHQAQIKTIKKSVKRTDYIIKTGWKLLQFYESEIKKDVSECVDKIERILGTKIFKEEVI